MSTRWTLFVACVALVGLVWLTGSVYAEGEGIRCQVNTAVLRVRSAPGEAQIGTALGGTWLTVTARNADTTWGRVEWSGRSAWVNTQFLRCASPLAELAEPDEAPATETAEAADSPAADAPDIDPMARRMLEAVNTVRARFGLPAYDLDPRAQAAAQWQADDMVKRRYFAHNTPDGRRPADLMRDQGLPCPGWCGQNIIMGQTKDEIGYAITWFMNSAVHRANLLHRRYVGIGVGVAEARPGVRYYVLNFFGE